ncbi:MAG: hypothetical protein WBG48_11715 [Pricia sp.]
MASSTFAKTTASIAAWNLATFERLSADRIKLQARGLQLLDAELVTLVEIKDKDHIENIVAYLSNNEVNYEYEFREQSPVGNNANHGPMHIGVIFKRGVKVDNVELMPGSDLDNPNYRKAFLCDVLLGKFSFKLIGVHLKSGRDLNNQKIRDRQCKVIGDYIQNLRGRGDRNPDVLLMGDFNMIPGQDISNFHFLGGDDQMNFVSSWDLQERYSHILPSGRENLLDGFAISKKYSTEYIRGSLRLFPMHWTMGMGQAKYRKEVSDHLPFVASFDITRSRD